VIRVIAEPTSFDSSNVGETFLLRVDEYSVFKDDGDDSYSKILT